MKLRCHPVGGLCTRAARPNAEETQRFAARGGGPHQDKPVIVLINGGSASASEIVAGALQGPSARDGDRHALVWQGLGPNHHSARLPATGRCGLTTARYFTPVRFARSRRRASRPDIEVPAGRAGRAQSAHRHERRSFAARDNLKSEGAEQTGSQSYIPPDPKDDKALHTAARSHPRIQKNSAYPPNPKSGRSRTSATTPTGHRSTHSVVNLNIGLGCRLRFSLSAQ